MGFPGVRSPPGTPREQPLPYGAYNRTLTALYSAITAIFGLISDCARDLFILTAAARPRRHRIKQASCSAIWHVRLNKTHPPVATSGGKGGYKHPPYPGLGWGAIRASFRAFIRVFPGPLRVSPGFPGLSGTALSGPLRASPGLLRARRGPGGPRQRYLIYSIKPTGGTPPPIIHYIPHI